MIDDDLESAPEREFGATTLLRARSQTRPAPRLGGTSAAEVFRPLIQAILGAGTPVRFEFWDGTSLGPAAGPGAMWVQSPDVVRRILWAPDEIGLGRAFVSGDVDIDGDLIAVLADLQRALPDRSHLGIAAVVAATRSAWRLGALGRPLPVPIEEARPTGVRHSRSRDARAVRNHYDVGNEFYRLVLGPSMTYSCARFTQPDMTLEQAQTAKHDLVCHKLGLAERTGVRLLDVGCGWGSMAMHAAARFNAKVLGITLSNPQAQLARQRIAEAGLGDQVEIRVQDYRDLSGESFDAISSIGMFEHVGKERMAEYFATLRNVLVPGGRLLNHAISTPEGSKLGRRSFIGRYVFPDGELIDVGEVVLGMQRAGFELRDVESLREHYALTLRTWLANLEDAWDDAVAQVGIARARIWRLYMAASVNGFEDGGIAVHQVLGVVPKPGGSSGMPPTRRNWD